MAGPGRGVQEGEGQGGARQGGLGQGVGVEALLLGNRSFLLNMSTLKPRYNALRKPAFAIS